MIVDFPKCLADFVHTWWRHIYNMVGFKMLTIFLVVRTYERKCSLLLLMLDYLGMGTLEIYYAEAGWRYMSTVPDRRQGWNGGGWLSSAARTSELDDEPTRYM